MSQSVTLEETAALLQKADHILLLTHQYPDGDTIGSGYALCQALQSLGKTARVACSDEIPGKYAYMTEPVPSPTFEPSFICGVDVADAKLLGPRLEPYADRVDLAIDHHASHRDFQRYLLLDADASATALLIYDLLLCLGAEMTPSIADCLYTGLATDTGCFKYGSTTPYAHRVAAALMEAGAQMESINRVMFDCKSRARVELERLALESMRFYWQGRLAVMMITNDMLQSSQAEENDMEGLAPLPRQIEGVWVGVTFRQKPDGNFKVSVRTGAHADASAICSLLGGGGHKQAAGCAINSPADAAVARIMDAVRQAVPGIDAG